MTPLTPLRTASEADIARRARALWAARGCPEGCDVEIWLEAERAVSAELAAEAAIPSRRAHTSTSISAKGLPPSGDENPVDNQALEERLDDFGEPPRRSATSVDLT
ncbi:MAG TPA: DUF2934 domain-containing protein [Opitutaceae bacterium]|nr:DUF2934 domain-containing protein [Opitutaceae bacterium]